MNSSVTERRVPHTEWLVRPSHSYGLMCYLLRSRGAEKLLAADPLRNLLPADEFISLMHGYPARSVSLLRPSDYEEILAIIVPWQREC